MTIETEWCGGSNYKFSNLTTTADRPDGPVGGAKNY